MFQTGFWAGFFTSIYSFIFPIRHRKHVVHGDFQHISVGPSTSLSGFCFVYCVYFPLFFPCEKFPATFPEEGQLCQNQTLQSVPNVNGICSGFCQGSVFLLLWAGVFQYVHACSTQNLSFSAHLKD